MVGNERLGLDPDLDHQGSLDNNLAALIADLDAHCPVGAIRRHGIARHVGKHALSQLAGFLKPDEVLTLVIPNRAGAVVRIEAIAGHGVRERGTGRRCSAIDHLIYGFGEEVFGRAEERRRRREPIAGEAVMDVEERRKQILGLVQTIAIAAMDLPPDERQAFIKRTVAMLRRNYEKTKGPDPDVIDAWGKLLDITRELVKTLEESGGPIGHA
jgi:hypothetical protein